MPTTETTESPQSSFGDLPKKHDINELNSLYLDGDSIDQEVFAEMRSNILLNSGEHYNRRQSNFYKRIRDSKELSLEQKLRLTKNHVQNICKKYVNNIMAHQPGVGFTPRVEDDLHCQKNTEFHKKLWQDAKEKYTLDDKMDDWCDDFVQVGEVTVKIFYDPNAGAILGFNPVIDEESGMPTLNEFQEAIPDPSKPVFEGMFIFEEVYGFNLLRPSECKDLRQSEWLCIRKMANKDELKARFKDQPDIAKYVVTSQDETYLVFDGSRGAYRKTKNQVMLREYYFRPCSLYPHGYFYITTKEGILSEGELPGGIFPIITAPFERIQTTPRGRSPVKHMRPYQAEINRSASKIAEHQITLGDDKLILTNTTKVSAGVSLPGVRTVNVSGGPSPTILAGRSGEQYSGYMKDNITEMYQVMNVEEDAEEVAQNMDPYILLYRAARQKKKFGRWIKRFEKFIIEVCKTYLRLAKLQMTDDAICKAIGEDERANIPEFRNSDDLSFNINIEAEADDIETKFGKQIVFNHTLQYVGSQLTRADIGKIMREAPYANSEGAFDDMTLDYDLSEDEILALDRGETPPISQTDNHQYLLTKLKARMRKRDFRYLSPMIQNNYQQKVMAHEQFISFQLQQQQRAESGFIPTGGYSVTCQMYATDPSDPTGKKTSPVRVPYQSLQWLVQQLQAQGQGQQEIAAMDPSTQSDIMGMMNGAPRLGMPPQPGGMPMRPGMPHPSTLARNGMVARPAMMPQPGTTMPMGAR